MTAGITTRLGQTTFRSRLEARWSLLFDSLGLHWEYEPFDADGYIPDFVLLGDRPLLVEIKPYADLRDFAAEYKRVQASTATTWRGPIAVFGVSPLVCVSNQPFINISPGVVTDEWDGDASPAAWSLCDCGTWSVFNQMGSYRSYPCGCHDGDHHLGETCSDSEVVRMRWELVRDATRWTR